MVEVRVGGREWGDSLLSMHVSRVNWLPGDLSDCPLPTLWPFKTAKQHWFPVLLHQFTILPIQHTEVKLPLDTGGSSLPPTSNMTSMSFTCILPIFLIPINLVLNALLVRKTNGKNIECWTLRLLVPFFGREKWSQSQFQNSGFCQVSWKFQNSASGVWKFDLHHSPLVVPHKIVSMLLLHAMELRRSVLCWEANDPEAKIKESFQFLTLF